VGSDDEGEDARPVPAKGSLGPAGSKRTTGDHDVIVESDQIRPDNVNRYMLVDPQRSGGGVDAYVVLDPDKPHPGDRTEDGDIVFVAESKSHPVATKDPDILFVAANPGVRVSGGHPRDDDSWRISPEVRKIIDEADAARRNASARGGTAQTPFGFSIRSGANADQTGGIDVHQLPLGVIPDEEPDISTDGNLLLVEAPNGAVTVRIPRATAVADDPEAVETALVGLFSIVQHAQRTLAEKNRHFLHRLLLVLNPQIAELETRKRKLLKQFEATVSDGLKAASTDDLVALKATLDLVASQKQTSSLKATTVVVPEPAVAHAMAASPDIETSSPTSTALAPANAGSNHPYRGHPKTLEQGMHPVLSRMLDGPTLSQRSLARVNDLCLSLVEQDTHPPILEGLVRVAVALERDAFLPTELLEEIENLHASWQIDGIHPELAEPVTTLLIRARKKIDKTYTMGLRAVGLLPLILFVMFLAGAPIVAFTVVGLLYAGGLAAGQQTMHLVNHRRKELDDMRAQLQPLLPPLKHRELQSQRIKALTDGGKK
jgi:hypothetical protein